MKIFMESLDLGA